MFNFSSLFFFFFFFFNDTATTEIYTLSLHDALPISKLRHLLHGDAAGDGRVAHKDIGAVGAWDWGPLLVARRMWSDLDLDTTLDQLARPDRREVVRLSDRALVLVANRLTAPASEHALAQWLESDFVCDRCGRLRSALHRGM